MKKILLGMSSLILSQNAYSSTVYRNFINVPEPEKMVLNLNNKNIIQLNKENLVKSTDFFNTIRRDGTFEDIQDFKLIKTYIVKSSNLYKLYYEAESKYKSVTLEFPIKYENGKLIDIYPVYYDAKKQKVLSHKVQFKTKNIKREIFDKLFLTKNYIELNKGTSDITYYILAESENKVSYETISNFFDKRGVIKDKYKKLNINLVLIPTNYYSEKYSMELSGLLSYIKDKKIARKIFVEYLKNRENLMNSIESKYFKKFKDGYAEDFILTMYKETNETLNTLSQEFISEILTHIDTKPEKDIISILKEQQNIVEDIIKTDILEHDVTIFKSYPDSKYYFTYEGKL